MKVQVEEVPTLLMPILLKGRQVLQDEREQTARAREAKAREAADRHLPIAELCRQAVTARVPDAARPFVQAAEEIRICKSAVGDNYAVVNIRIPGAAWMAVLVAVGPIVENASVAVTVLEEIKVGKPEWLGPEAGLVYTFHDPYRTDGFAVALAVAREAYESGVLMAEQMKDIPF